MLRKAIAALAALSIAPAAAAPPAAITGHWATDDGKAVIEVAPCGASLCGKIQRFLIPEPRGGAVDSKNPDKAKRNRNLLGVLVLWNLAADGDAWKGQGYSPEEGRHFNATVSADGGKLRVRGCVTLFCRTVVWTRMR